MRDLGCHPDGVRTEEWRTLSWHCGAACADDVCAWASAREDGAHQLACIITALSLLGRTGEGARDLVLKAITDEDPAFTPCRWVVEVGALEGP